MLRNMTQEEYVSAWTYNAKQHFEDGDYEWICDQIKPYNNVLEIGCGAGYSTLTLILRDHKVLSVDSNPHAIQKTKDLITENNFEAEIATSSIEFDKSDAWLWNFDVIGSRGVFIDVVKQLPIDLILLCNPGGNLDPNLRMNEVNLLMQYGFTRAEIDQRYQEGAIHLLHKFSLIDSAADVAIKCEKPFMLVERGSKEQSRETLEQISLDTGMRCVFEDSRKIHPEPAGGIPLGDINGNKSDDLYWACGMYFSS